MISRGGAKEEDFLAGRLDTRPDYLREKLAEPRPAREYVEIGGNFGVVREENALHPATRNRPRTYRKLTIFATFFQESGEHCFTVAARGEKPRVFLVKYPAHTLKIHLRPTLCCFVRAQLFDGQASLTHDGNGGFFVTIIFARHAKAPDLAVERPIP